MARRVLVRELFTRELDQVGVDLVQMATQVATAIEQGSKALQTADLALAERVIDADVAIDDLERILDERCVDLLARQSPVAGDLRLVVTALRMSASIERMGDLARHIAQVARGRYPQRAVPAPLTETFDQMADAAIQAARSVAELLQSRDVKLASEIEAADDTLDALHRDTFRTMLTQKDELTSQQIVDVTLLGRYYERFGDHAVSVARRVSYLVTGDPADFTTEGYSNAGSA
jgi:phosphate transport system protein